MIGLKRRNENYKKKYDELLTILSKVLVEKQDLKDENQYLRDQIKRLIKERNNARDGLLTE